MRRQSFSTTRWLFVFSFMFLFNAAAFAHSVGQSYIFLQVYENQIDGRFEMMIKDMNIVFDLTHPDSMITKENYAQYVEQIQGYVTERIQMSIGDNDCQFRFTKHDLLKTSEGVFITISFNIAGDLAKIPENIDVQYRVFFDKDPEHKAFLVIEHYWKANLFQNERIFALVFTKDAQSQPLDLTDASIWKGFVGVVKQGIKHIWIGIDHILFIIALILPAVMYRRQSDWEPVSEFKPALIYVIKIISLFTIAHSITLSIAALGILDLPPRIVESIIAISIAIAALDIIFPIFKGKIGWVVFGFGLFHGFGFASVLSHLGILGEHMALSLFGFNLGVEIGQVAIICVVFPALFLIRNISYYRSFVLKAGAVGLIVIALYWFIERAFEIEMPLAQFL